MSVRIGQWLVLCLTAASVEGRPLTMPGRDASVEALHPSIIGMASIEGSLVLLPASQGYVIVTPFNSEGKDRVERFGKLLDSKRRKAPIPPELDAWHLAVGIPDHLLVVEGRLALIADLGTSYKSIGMRSIVWDLLKPARDRGGEAPMAEVRRLRAKFKEQFLATKGIRLAGISAAPPGWFDSSKYRDYILSTAIEHFPIVSMQCSADVPSQCQLSRACFVKDMSGIEPKSLAGIGVLSGERIFVVGDRKRHRVVGFRFDSCFHITPVFALELPDRIKRMGSIHVDAKERLWVTAMAPDDYSNSSVFMWNKSDWYSKNASSPASLESHQGHQAKTAKPEN